MDLSDASAWLTVPLQILLVDLLLGADNALVIALACRRLPPQEVRRAATLGVLGAIIIRILLALVASALLALPFVKLIGAIILLVIAMNLVGDAQGDELPVARPGASLWSAAATILIADTIMSLDNVVALAAIAQGNIWWLAAGVALSLPIIAFGGVMLADVLKRAPWLVEIGAALLGWIALQLAMTDAVIGDAIAVNAPALGALAPLLGAGFVFAYGRLGAGAQRRAPRRAASPIGGAGSRKIEDVVAAAPKAETTSINTTRNASLLAASVERGNEINTPPATRVRAAPLYDTGPEPQDQHEPLAVPRTREDRVAIIGVLLLAVVAGTILMLVSYLDSFN